jgi:hypothetical protein
VCGSRYARRAYGITLSTIVRTGVPFAICPQERCLLTPCLAEVCRRRGRCYANGGLAVKSSGQAAVFIAGEEDMPSARRNVGRRQQCKLEALSSAHSLPVG